MSDKGSTIADTVAVIIKHSVLANKETRDLVAAEAEQLKAEAAKTRAEIGHIEADTELTRAEAKVRIAEAAQITARTQLMLTGDLATERSLLIEQAKRDEDEARGRS